METQAKMKRNVVAIIHELESMLGLPRISIIIEKVVRSIDVHLVECDREIATQEQTSRIHLCMLRWI